MQLTSAMAIASAVWGVINLLQVLIGKWNSPTWIRTLYTVATITAGIGALGAVGINDGWLSRAAGFGLLNHLSAGLVYTMWCRQKRTSAG